MPVLTHNGRAPTMKTSAILLATLLCFPASAVQHPTLIDPVITKCGTHNGTPCAQDVYYSASGLSVTDVEPVAPPIPAGDTELMALGLHCVLGDQTKGTPFSECLWFAGNAHAPTLANCRLASTESWELDPTSTCSLSNPTWGPHTGAGPGGECVVFVQKRSVYAEASVRTVFGDLTALQVANAGSTFCQKALPPAQKCEIDLPAVVEHGAIGTTDHSIIIVDGTVDCGANPVITVMGGGTVNMAPGVTSDLALQVVGTNQIRVTSVVDSTNADPGDYSVTRVVIASPY